MKRRDTIVRYTAPERINHWITAFLLHPRGGERAGLFVPVLQLVDANHGHTAAGANSAPVCRRGYVCLVHHHVFPLLASQPNQSG